jgi:hypothetical protein
MFLVNKAKGTQMQNVTREKDGLTFNVAVNKMFTVGGDGLWSNTATEVFVTDIGMFVSITNEADEGDEACYYDGDMYALTTAETWDESELGLIYTDTAFLECVRTELIKAGISVEAATAVSYSEQGMQDEGRVSLDAFEVADYVRARMLVAA